MVVGVYNNTRVQKGLSTTRLFDYLRYGGYFGLNGTTVNFPAKLYHIDSRVKLNC